MHRDPPSRRDFVAGTGSALGGAWLLGLAPVIAATQACARDAARNGLPLVTLTGREGADFDALAARIVPSGATPGAREAGAVHFADRALSTFLADLLPTVRESLGNLAERVSVERGAPFAELSEDVQDALVADFARDEPGAFYILRMLVLLALVTDPAYGGNRGSVGWRLIGFEDRFAYGPPFGFYDRDEHGGDSSGRGA